MSEFVYDEERFDMPQKCVKEPKLKLTYQIAYVTGRGDRIELWLEVWNNQEQEELIASRKVGRSFEELSEVKTIKVEGYVFKLPNNKK